MLPVLIDAGMFAVHPYAPDEEDVHNLIDRMLHWSSISDGGAPVRLFKLSGTAETLQNNNFWPMEGDVAALLELFNLTGMYTVRDVVGSYMSLYAKTEDWGDSYAEVVEVGSISLDPDILANEGPPAMTAHSKLVYVNQAFHDTVNSGKNAFIASGLPHHGPSSTVLDGEIVRVEGAGAHQLDVPVVLSRSVRLLDRLEDVATFGAAISQWNSAENNQDLFAAISFGCLAISRANGRSMLLNEIANFSIGSEFFSSLSNIQAGPGQPRANLVLECCCRIVLGVPKNEIKPMGKPDQMVRAQDKATAWRTHITKAHEGSRLMLWRSNGSYEFANVGVKLEEYIAKGTPADRYSHVW